MAESQAIVHCQTMISVMLRNYIWYSNNHTIYWLWQNNNKNIGLEQLNIQKYNSEFDILKSEVVLSLLGQSYVT